MEEITIKEESGNPCIDLALDTIRLKKQALIFVNTKRSAEKTAEDIAKKCSTTVDLMNLAEKAQKSLSKPTKQCERLARCIKHGTAFHHAGLTQGQKTLIEDNFRTGQIQIIACTPSLAMGVDLPAFRSILRDLKRYGRRGLQYIQVLEYMQMAGRAGRPKFDKIGQAVIVAGTEALEDELTERYINGKPENIYSKLAVEPVLRTYLLSLISARFVRTKKQIMEFFSKTFWAHQYQDLTRLELIIERMLSMLVDFEFLVSSREEFSDASDLENSKYRATRIGRRVAELYLDPLTAYNFINSMRRATTHTKTISYLQLISYTPELRPLLRVKMSEHDEIMEEYAGFEDNIIVLEPSAFDMDYDEFLNSVKTALFFQEWTQEYSEEYLLEKFSVRPGEIRAKLDIADWLTFSLIELCKILNYRRRVSKLIEIRMRLRYGVKKELLPLLKLKGIGRVRARAMYKNRIRSVGDIKKTDVGKLGSIIRSRAIAEDVKEQLGQKVEKVKEGKRVGQKALV